MTRSATDTSSGTSTTSFHTTTGSSTTSLTTTLTTITETSITESSITESSITESMTTWTATPRRFSTIKSQFGVDLDSTVTQAQVEIVAQSSIATYLETSESLITIDDVYEVILRRRPVAERKLTSAATLWHVDYRVEFEGVDYERVQRAVASIENDTVAGQTNFTTAILASLANEGINSSVHVRYVFDPVVELWMYTTATLTSTSMTTTSSTTCCVCPWPDVDPVPIQVAGPDFDTISSLHDLLRIECTGFKWGDICTPVCAEGYHVEETLLCSSVTENGAILVDGEWQGTARCEPNVCVGSPQLEMPVGYDGVDTGCSDRNYTQTCNVSCSVDDGYENLADPISIECTATTAYAWVNTTGACTEKACYADTVPFIANVVDSSSCINIASGVSCSPVCNSSYELLAPINCTRGAFDLVPLVCVPTADVEALDSAVGLVVEAALVGSSPGSDLTAEWAAGSEQWQAIKGAFGAVLGLSTGQIYVYTIKGLNSDYQSGLPSRRLTTSQGLWMRLLFQVYPTNSETTIASGLASLGADGGNFTRELVAALRDAHAVVPQGLAAATLVVGTPASTVVTVPVARWVARGTWSACTNPCGKGEQTRTVRCLTGFEELCNANAAPGYTKESFMPDTRDCETYISCPYDWSCPSGGDPVTGEGCEAQASVVMGSIVVSFFLVCCCCVRYVRRMIVLPTRGFVGVRLGRDGAKVDIEWTRDDGIVGEDGHQKPRLSYNLGPDEMAQFYEDRERAPGCATLIPWDEAEDPIGPVDLDFSGTVDFEMQLTVRTLAKDSLVIGKVFPDGETPYGSGKPKALVIKNGVPAWQIGDKCITGQTNVADGYQHELSVKYSTSQDAYILEVDGVVEAEWRGAVVDHPDTKLCLGTSCAPRNDKFNELYEDLEELHIAGIEVHPLEERGGEPLFDGDIDELTWKEYRWNKNLGRMAWFAYELSVEAEEAIGTVMKQRATAWAPLVPLVEVPSVSASHIAFEKGQTVEYWSKTMQAWIPARIVDFKHVYFDKDLEINMIKFSVNVMSAGQVMPKVEMKYLRLPLNAGEPVCIFSPMHGKWFPAVVSKSREVFDARLGYDVTLEDRLADDGETFVKTELQRDLEKYYRDRRDRERAEGGYIPERRSLQPEESRDGVPTLKSMPAKRLRRRYTRGDLVSVYRGVDVGFTTAEVVREMDTAEQGLRAEPEQAVRGKRATPSPRSSLATDGEEDMRRLERELDRKLAGMPAKQLPQDAQPRLSRSSQRLSRSSGSDHEDEASGAATKKTKNKAKASASDHRHATIVIRPVSHPQESKRGGGSEGAVAMPGDTEIQVPEFLLRPMPRRISDQQEDRSRSLAAGVLSSLRRLAPQAAPPAPPTLAGPPRSAGASPQPPPPEELLDV
ncbi:unnamed protein product [Prorocentrum cordatum]|uniref:Uncharacterized protein n=1 Tax=Prorocentrum cordatum TaxID=2364126 RepID=A0ABN9W757_9DINO|nr:unnamed protein product [Polarella glacialis]